jgi:uncharacterized protein with von Willebrand factor type A (vWA) domain
MSPPKTQRPLPANSKAQCCPTCGKSTTLYAWRNFPPQKESDAYRKRIRNMVAQFQLEGYDTYERDLSTACAVAQLMAAEGQKPPREQRNIDHLQQILDMHMERIIASQIAESLINQIERKL